jgi:hypothetical protein
LQFASAVSVDGERAVSAMAGLRVSKPPLKITVDGRSFFVGPRAHDWGRPVENLDPERLTGSPELQALLYGAMFKANLPQEPITLMVGLPVDALTGTDAKRTVQAVKDFFRGKHDWQANDQPCHMEVVDVRATSQPAAGLFDYLLDDEGRFIPERKAHDFPAELGILNIGMNTMDLLVVRGGVVVQKFTAGETLGVRRLLEMINRDGAYSLAELDEQLRAGRLDIAAFLPVYEREALGFVERQWGKTFTRFRRVITIGGGVLLLGNALLRRFGGRIHVSDDPVLATARGLYKFGLMEIMRKGE